MSRGPRADRSSDAPGISEALLGAAALSAAAAVIAIGGVVADPNFRITGAQGWLKPLKFAISITLYCASVAWLLQYARSRRAARIIGGITAASLVIELALIDFQVLRGRASHFNTATLSDKIVYRAMAGFAGVAFLAGIAAAFLLAREPDVPEPLATGIRAGLVVTLVGMAQAVSMVAHGGHTVGGPDGGPGLPLTGWSSEHGDLRVAHFVGLHALQGLPLLAWLVERARPVRGAPDDATARGTARRLTLVGAGSWTGAIALLTWQAERGQPLLRPNGATATAACGLVAATLAATVGVLRGARSAGSVRIPARRGRASRSARST